jgi:hypothetical protein
VFVNERPFPQQWPVVDGKQRLEAIIAWITGVLWVPRDWFTDDAVIVAHDGAVNWSMLTGPARRRCENHWLIAQYRTSIPADAEPELYERINYGGTPHEPLEVA